MLVKKPWNNTKEYNQPEFPLLKIYLWIQVIYSTFYFIPLVTPGAEQSLRSI